jgi:flavin-dependent dehydrogenase
MSGGREPRGPVHIIGGGLAGLGLGLALRRDGVPVVVHEAGTYPRHRVCGEFISGLSESEVAALGLVDVLAGAPRHRSTAWFRGAEVILRAELPDPAIAISRHALDAAMARRLVDLGAEVRCGERMAGADVGGGDTEGRVVAHGRHRQAAGRWLGLKAHYTGLEVAAGLEMHLGRGGYAGLTALGDGRVNVCALLPAGPTRAEGKAGQLPARLDGIGLGALAARLRAACCDERSVTGVTQFGLGWQPATVGGGRGGGPLVLGDGTAIIPPFTGHGMAMALQGALTAAPFLGEWWRGDSPWEGTRREAGAAVHRRFAARLRWAATFHPFMLHPAGQRALAGLSKAGWLPFAWLFRRVR